MITKKHLIITGLLTFCLTATLFALGTMRSSLGIGEYDPWVDVNDDGQIEMRDIAYPASLYGAIGDPTKNVNVTNWPASTAVTEWYSEPVDDSTPLVSNTTHYASGFGHLHILMRAALTSTESVEIIVLSPLYSYAHTSYFPIRVYSHNLTSGSPYYNVTIPVPCDEFYFAAVAAIGTTTEVSLRYYLTWA